VGLRFLALLAVVTAVSAVAATAGRAAPPVTAAMTLGPLDFPDGAVLVRQGAKLDAWLPKIAASSVYSRSFRNARIGKVDLPTVNAAAILAKRTTDVTALMSSLVLVARSPAGRKAFLAEIKASMGPSASKVTSTKVVRARPLQVGDSAVELVFHFDTAGASFEVGELWVSVGKALSVVLFLAAEPGVSAGQGTALAKALADHLRLGLAPVPKSTARPVVTGTPQIGQTLSATTGRWSTSLAELELQWLRCDATATTCTAIPGATLPTYTVAAADVGSTLVVSVEASTPAGTATARSRPTPLAA
jgi:hypothetical protein